MATTAARGGEITLSVQFYEYPGGPGYNPAGLTLEILFNNQIELGPLHYPGPIQNPSLGNFRYTWFIPTEAQLGTYIVRWSGVVNGSQVAGIEEVEVGVSGDVTAISVQLNDPSIAVMEDGIRIKFDRTIKASSIVNERFPVFLNTVEHPQVVDPFLPIDVLTDYDSIGRWLYLHFKAEFLPSTSYVVRVQGLSDVASRPVDTTSYTFTTLSHIEEYDVDPPPLPIEDSSISLTKIFTPNPSAFYVSSVLPGPDEYFVEEGYRLGRITVKFSTDPASNYVNKDYFRVQRKKVQRLATRWETVETVITSEADRPWVHIYFPSDDEEPVYGKEGKTYFQPGYKYRIKISKDIGI